MRLLCLDGPQAAGKTTVAKLLKKACATAVVVHGDDYILEDGELWDDLRGALTAGDLVLFEHVSASKVARQMGLSPSLVVSLRPTEARMSVHRRVRYGDSAENLHCDQAALQESDRPAGVVANTPQEALSFLLKHLMDDITRSMGIREFVIKTTSTCNIKCKYCYMYEANDASYVHGPARMADETAVAAARRIADYIEENSIQQPTIIFHGGEPLMLSASSIRALSLIFRAHIADCRLAVQTNAIPITPAKLRALDELGFSVGVSIDGAHGHHNALRVGRSGRDTTPQALKGLKYILEYPFERGGFGGVLSVVNSECNGREVYQGLRDLGVKKIDFLLNGDRRFVDRGQPVYTDGEFLVDAFDAWCEDNEVVEVRLFQAVIAQILGEDWSVDAIGLYPMSLAGVDPSGNWELLDCLRLAEDNAWKTPFGVFETSLSGLIDSEPYRNAILSQYDLADECMSCEHLVECGGGYIAHRFRHETGYRNPSLNCGALKVLFNHVKRYISIRLI